jgi:hypothetical protein
MRSFIVACIAVLVIAIAGAVALNFIQEPASVAFVGDGVRL